MAVVRAVPTGIWRQLLDRSAARCDPGDHRALDATFFDREAASRHYADRSDRHIRTLRTTALIDTDSYVVLDLHCSAHWLHDTQVGRRVALRNTEKIESLAGDKGYDSQRTLGQWTYGQRWMAKTAFSAIKRRYGSVVGPSAWYREFREFVLNATVYNLEQAI